VLGVREQADALEIKAAYRNLMMKWHPDRCRHVDATRRTEEVSLAYSVLSCPESRFNHDLQLREAGLSSKPLFVKTSLPCLDCYAKGYKKVYSRVWYHGLMRFLKLSTPFEEHLCLTCCGTGIEHKIEEI